MSTSWFDRLPDNILQRIETSLNAKDRLAFFSCCRAARAYQVAAPDGLWPQLEFELRNVAEAQALAAWLARNRQHLGTLKLGACFLPPGGGRRSTAVFEQSGAEAAHAILVPLRALAGSSVHTLSVEVPYANVDVGDWLLCLPHLESLSMQATHLTMSVDLPHLTRLASLSLCLATQLTGFGMFRPLTAGMPPCLRELSLCEFDAGAFGACARLPGALPQLRALKLQRPSVSWASVLPWDWLPLRTALTSLTLEDWMAIRALPEQLAALTGLQQLTVKGCFLWGTDEALAPLAALTGLTRLAVPSNRFRSIPGSVFALPSLKELDASRCGGDALAKPDIPLAGSSSLTKLCLTATLAMGAARQLARFPALHTLRLSPRFNGIMQTGEEQDPKHHEAVGRLLVELKRLPRLAVLDVSDVHQGGYRRVFRLLWAVLNMDNHYPYQLIGSESNDDR